MFTDHVQMSDSRDITAVEVRKCSAVAEMAARGVAQVEYLQHALTL